MAYIGNQPAPSNVNSASIEDGSIKNVDIAADAAIEVSKLDGVTATNTELNKLDGVTASTADLNTLSGAVSAGVTSTELQHLSGVTSNIQTQINAASGGATKGTLTKSFVTGETASIALSSASTPTASVFVTKEIAQVGVSNGDWNVNAADTGYDIEDFAYNEALSIDTVNSTATLATSPWSADDVGKKIVGGGGEASLVDTTGTIQISVPFSTSSPTLAAGSWNFYGVVFSNTGVSLARGDGNVTTTFDLRDDFKYNTTQELNFDTAFTPMTAEKFRLSPDGAKLFILDINGGVLRGKGLTTPFNITTASGTLDSYDPTNTITASDFFFSSDGLKLFMLNTAESVEEYALAAPYVISGATFTASVDISTIVTVANSFTFSSEGENLLVLDSSTARVHQYALSTAWDLSTLTYTAKSGYVGSQDTSTVTAVSWSKAYQIEINPAFSELYVSTEDYRSQTPQGGAKNFRIHTFRMQTVGDVGTIKYVPRSMGAESYPFTITENGRSVITTNRTTNIYKGGLGTPYALGETSFFRTADISFDFVANSLFDYTLISGETWRNTVMSPNGKFVLGLVSTTTTNFLLLGRLDIPYDLGSNFTITQSKVNLGTITSLGLINAAFWNANSTEFYLQRSTSLTIHGRRINSDGFLTTSYIITSDGSFVNGAYAMSLDGTRLYATPTATTLRERIYQFNLLPANSLSGVTINEANASGSFHAVGDALSQASVDANFISVTSPTVIANNKIAVTASNSQGVITYTLTDPNDISTAHIADFNDVSGFDQGLTLARSSIFSSDGLRLFTAGTILREINLQGAYRIHGNVSQRKQLLNVNAEASTINADETKAYQFESTSGLITEMNLGTKPFTYHNITATGATFSATTHDSTPQDILFSADGSKLFVVGNNTDAIYSYLTPTAFDLSTTTTLEYDSYPFSEDTDVRSVVFSSDGLKLFMLGNANKTVYQYTLTTPYDLTTVSYDSVSLNLQVFPSPLEAVDAITLSSDDKILFLSGTITEEANTATTQHIIANFTLPTAKSLVGAELNKFSPMYSTTSLSFNSEGTRYYTQARVNSGERGYSNASVTPKGQNLAAITNSVNRIDTEYWIDINSMTAISTFNNSGVVYFAVSLDAQTTFKVASNDNGIRTIVRNNAGTWEYNSNTTYGFETWVAASYNTEFTALAQALDVAANQMDRTQLGEVSDFNHFTVADTLDLAIILRQDTDGTPPISDGVSINYDAQALNKGAILGTDYDYDVPTNTSVRITSLKDQNLKVKVV